MGIDHSGNKKGLKEETIYHWNGSSVIEVKVSHYWKNFVFFLPAKAFDSSERISIYAIDCDPVIAFEETQKKPRYFATDPLNMIGFVLMIKTAHEHKIERLDRKLDELCDKFEVSIDNKNIRRWNPGDGDIY